MSLIRHFTATGIVFNDAGDVLLIHHGKLHKWLPPGGHIDPNEAPGEAAVREIAEETGVTAHIIHPALFTHSAVVTHPTPWAIIEMDVEDRRIGPHRHIDMVYVCRADHTPPVAQLAEVHDARWVPADEVAALPAPDELPDLIAEAATWAKEHSSLLMSPASLPRAAATAQ